MIGLHEDAVAKGREESNPAGKAPALSPFSDKIY